MQNTFLCFFQLFEWGLHRFYHYKRISKWLPEYRTWLKLQFEWLYLHFKWCRTLTKVISNLFEYVLNQFTTITEYQNGNTNIKLGWKCTWDDFIYILNDAEHNLRSLPITVSKLYINSSTISNIQISKWLPEYQHEFQNKYQSGNPHIKLGWNWSSNDSIYTLDNAEHFLRSYQTILTRFYITFTAKTEYQIGYPNIKIG